MRLIDADALMDAFRKHMVERYDREKCVSEENCKACERGCLWRMKVMEAPTIEAEPVKHGVWDFVAENSTGKIFLCSVCGIPYNPSEKEVDRGRLQERPNYCPNCGARMDGE